MNEPLKDKLRMDESTVCTCERILKQEFFFKREDVKSATEWLKAEIKRIELPYIDYCEMNEYSIDEEIKGFKNYLVGRVDKAFSDVKNG